MPETKRPGPVTDKISRNLLSSKKPLITTVTASDAENTKRENNNIIYFIYNILSNLHTLVILKSNLALN